MLAEIDKIAQPELASLVRSLLVPIRCEQREWDYGSESQTYPCWIFAQHAPTNTAYAYCDQGFGPISPWGLLFIHGQYSSMGMDSGWFVTLEGAFRDSMAWDGVNPPGYQGSRMKSQMGGND